MSRKIPMVGDEADASTALHEALEQDGFIVDSYEDPLYALAHFKAHFYNPLIVDIKMPKIGVFRFIKRSRN